MKSFLKFSLLLALIVVGRFSKQPAPTVVAQAPAPTSAARNPIPEITLVHQVLTSEPVLPQPPLLSPYADTDLRPADTMSFNAF